MILLRSVSIMMMTTLVLFVVMLILVSVLVLVLLVNLMMMLMMIVLMVLLLLLLLVVLVVLVVLLLIVVMSNLPVIQNNLHVPLVHVVKAEIHHSEIHHSESLNSCHRCLQMPHYQLHFHHHCHSFLQKSFFPCRVRLILITCLCFPYIIYLHLFLISSKINLLLPSRATPDKRNQMKRSLADPSSAPKTSKTPRTLLMSSGVDISNLHTNYAEQVLLLEKIRLLETLSSDGTPDSTTPPFYSSSPVQSRQTEKASVWSKVLAEVPVELCNEGQLHTVRVSPLWLAAIAKDSADSSLWCLKVNLASPDDSEQFRPVTHWKPEWHIICTAAADPHILVIYIDDTMNIFGCRFNSDTKLEPCTFNLGVFAGSQKRNGSWRVQGAFTKGTELLLLNNHHRATFAFTPELELVISDTPRAQRHRVCIPCHENRKGFSVFSSLPPDKGGLAPHNSPPEEPASNTVYFFCERNAIMSIPLPLFKVLDDPAQPLQGPAHCAERMKFICLDSGQPVVNLRCMMQTGDKGVLVTGLVHDDYARLMVCRTSQEHPEVGQDKTFMGRQMLQEKVSLVESATTGPRPLGKNLLATVFVPHSSLGAAERGGQGLDRVVVFSRTRSERNAEFRGLDVHFLTLAGKADTRSEISRVRRELGAKSEKPEDRNLDVFTAALWSEVKTCNVLLSLGDQSHTTAVHSSIVAYYFPFFRGDLERGVLEFCVGGLRAASLEFLVTLLYGQELPQLTQQLTPDDVLVLFGFFANEGVRINPARLLRFVSAVPHTPTQTAELFLLTVRLHTYYAEILEMVPWLSPNQERVWGILMNEALAKISAPEERKIIIFLYHKFVSR